MNADQNATPSPSQVAVTCGRIVLIFVGLALIAIPPILAYVGIKHFEPLYWICLCAGVITVLLAIALPPKTVANVGFDIPFFLPEDD